MKKSIILFLSFALISCENREWNNPFDPACPKDIWAPTSLNAEIQGSNVKLSWNKTSDLISGYRLSKIIDNGLDTVFPDQTRETAQFIDKSIDGGKVHHYKLIAFAGENKSNEVTLDITPIIPPSVKTYEPSLITDNSVTISGEITSNGGAEIEEKGIFWSNGYTGMKVKYSGANITTYSVSISGLMPSVKYTFWSYAINSKGISFGNEVCATTLKGAPIVVSISIYPSGLYAYVRYQIMNDGGLTMTASGICWSKSHNPTIADNRNVYDPSYYFRPYATNSLGTGYGNEMSYTTP